MSTEIFAHGIGRVDLLGGTVRIELSLLNPSEQPNGAPVPKPCQAIYMPVEGFIQGVGALEQFVRKMADAGVIRLTPVNGEQGKPQ